MLADFERQVGLKTHTRVVRLPGRAQLARCSSGCGCCLQDAALTTLTYQLRKISDHTAFNHARLIEEGEWMSSEELTVFVEKEKHKAIALMQVNSPALH